MDQGVVADLRIARQRRLHGSDTAQATGEGAGVDARKAQDALGGEPLF